RRALHQALDHLLVCPEQILIGFGSDRVLTDDGVHRAALDPPQGRSMQSGDLPAGEGVGDGVDVEHPAAHSALAFSDGPLALRETPMSRSILSTEEIRTRRPT